MVEGNEENFGAKIVCWAEVHISSELDFSSKYDRWSKLDHGSE